MASEGPVNHLGVTFGGTKQRKKDTATLRNRDKYYLNATCQNIKINASHDVHKTNLT